jgi:hypothetical protein
MHTKVLLKSREIGCGVKRTFGSDIINPNPNKGYEGSEVFTVVVMKSIIFWDVTLATCLLAGSC